MSAMIAQLKPFDFTERPAGHSFAASGGSATWPREWVCKNCAWCATENPKATHIWCRAWKRSFRANSDRMCYEEPIEIMRQRKALTAYDPTTTHH
jgi:hypothetical protein